MKLGLTGFDASTGGLVWQAGTVLRADTKKDGSLWGAGPARRSTLPEVRDYPAAARRRPGPPVLGFR